VTSSSSLKCRSLCVRSTEGSANRVSCRSNGCGKPHTSCPYCRKPHHYGIGATISGTSHTHLWTIVRGAQLVMPFAPVPRPICHHCTFLRSSTSRERTSASCGLLLYWRVCYLFSQFIEFRPFASVVGISAKKHSCTGCQGDTCCILSPIGRCSFSELSLDNLRLVQ
jgi:hypothetical protein